MKKIRFISILLLFACLFLVSCKTKENEELVNPNIDPTSKIGVIYFSCSSHTKNVALAIASYYNVEPLEIIPSKAYTTNDLNYNNSSSRVALENSDDSARPKIKNTFNIDNFDTIFLGYPIWYGKAPKIIYTFVESYALKNKTIIPFCTSASSPIGSSAKNLESLNGGIWLKGKRFGQSFNQNEVTQFLDSLKTKKS